METISEHRASTTGVATILARILDRCFASLVRAPRRVAVLSASFMALTLTGHGHAQSPDPVRRLDVADYRAYLAEDHSVRQGLVRFSALVAVKSRGNLLVHVRKDTVPGSPSAQIDAVRHGSAGAPALMLFAATGLASLQKELGMFDLPYALRNAGQVEAVVNGPIGDRLLARLVPSGLVGLSWWENGFRQVTTSTDPVRAAADFRALTMRVVPEPVFTESFRALGAQTKALPVSRLYEALKAGDVNAQEGFESLILQGRLYEVQKHLSVTNHSYGAMVLAVNAQVWSGLPETDRQWLREAAVEAGREQRSWARDEAVRTRGQLRAHGMQIHELTPAASRAMVAATEPVRKKFSAEYDSEIRAMYLREVERGRQ